MHLEILRCLVFLGATFAIEIDIRENQKLDIHLKTCLSTVIEKICPACLTRHLIIPSEPSWEAHAIVSHFSDSSPIYGVTMYTLDRPGYEDLMINQVGLYLVNTEGVLKTALKHLGEASPRRKYVVWMNFDFGRSLDTYLKNTIPANWNGGNAWDIIFVALIEGSLHVLRTPIYTSGTLSTRSFRKLGFCDTKTLIEGFQPLPKLIESKKTTITVALAPRLLPFIERRTNDPGGYIGKFMKVVSSRLNFTTKYNWSVEPDDLANFARGDDLRIAFDMFPGPKHVSAVILPVFSNIEAVWVVATRDPVGRRNVLATPFNTSILLHITLLLIYTAVLVYLTKDLDKTRIMLRLFGMFFGIGVGWWPSKAPYSSLVVLWCCASYILLQAYLATLTSELSSPIIEENFHDAQALLDSGIEIICSKDMKEFFCHLGNYISDQICEKCMPYEAGMFGRMHPDQLSRNKTWRSFVVTAEVQIFKGFLASKFTRILPQRLGTWPTTIHTNTDEEFVLKMNNISTKLVEAGILEYWRSQHYLKNVDWHESVQQILDMAHLNDIFIILYVGWSCSIVVFIIEISMKWYRNR